MSTIQRSFILALATALAFRGDVNGWSQPNRRFVRRLSPNVDPRTDKERRRSLQFITGFAVASFLSSSFASPALAAPPPAAGTKRKCTDIESCREIGDRKVQQDLEEKPIVRLDSGVRYKKLRPGVGGATTAKSGDTVDIIFSISRANGAYMYSRGFGFEKVLGVDVSEMQSDEGLDSYRVQLGKLENRDVPLGVEQAIVGMQKGERRRIEVPPSVGLETSDWRPEPSTRRGKAQIVEYQTILKGRGTNQPPFPAPTIWDVEVLSFRSE